MMTSFESSAIATGSADFQYPVDSSLTVLSFRSQEKISVGVTSGSHFCTDQYHFMRVPWSSNTHLLFLDNLSFTPVPKFVKWADYTRNANDKMQ